MSNPCFEIWLIFHKKSIKDFTQDEKDKLFENKKNSTGSTETELLLRKIYGSYNKSQINFDIFLPDINTAIKNSRDTDIEPNTRWPDYLGTRVYLLVEKIIFKNEENDTVGDG